ncbi:MAG: hypothetical protein AAFN16_13915 [Pseudomonadota bacterium]
MEDWPYATQTRFNYLKSNMFVQIFVSKVHPGMQPKARGSDATNRLRVAELPPFTWRQLDLNSQSKP